MNTEIVINGILGVDLIFVEDLECAFKNKDGNATLKLPDYDINVFNDDVMGNVEGVEHLEFSSGNFTFKTNVSQGGTLYDVDITLRVSTYDVAKNEEFSNIKSKRLLSESVVMIVEDNISNNYMIGTKDYPLRCTISQIEISGADSFKGWEYKFTGTTPDRMLLIEQPNT